MNSEMVTNRKGNRMIRSCLWMCSLACLVAISGCKTENDSKRERANDRRPVSVATAQVIRKDMPLSLDGLGTVTAYQTVTVRSQVDGRLIRVNFREGQKVKQGDLLAVIDARNYGIQLRQAEAANIRDQAQLENAKVNLQRYTNVSKDKLIAQQQVDDQQTLVHQLEGQVKANQAQMDQAKLLLDYSRIRSPIDGIAGVRLVDPGNFVRAAEAGGIVVVTQINPIAVLFTLPQDDLPRVQQAMAVGKPKVLALSRDGNTVLAEGVLEVIDNQINANTATLRLKAVFPNPKQTLWPNQFVKARLHLGVRPNALVVTAMAIQRGPEGAFVYVVSDEKKALLRPVEVDTVENELAILRSGITAGETVVTEGHYQLKPGMLVESRTQAGKGDGNKGKKASVESAQ
jgi:multidrug efflux system membrane fusion protein